MIVLPDEPTANLDSQSGSALMDMMRRLNEEQGTTFVFSTHDPMVVERARRVIRLRDGRIEADERKASVMIWKLALRNVMRNRRRSGITVLSIAVGLAALTFLWGFIDGQNRQMVNNTTRYFADRCAGAPEGLPRRPEPGPRDRGRRPRARGGTRRPRRRRGDGPAGNDRAREPRGPLARHRGLRRRSGG